MRRVFEIKPKDDTTVSVRRCFFDDDQLEVWGDEEVVELTVERIKLGSWSLMTVCLSPEEAVEVARALMVEATLPLEVVSA